MLQQPGPARVVRFVLGDGQGMRFPIPHGLATQFVQVQVYRNVAPFPQEAAAVECTDASTVTVSFTTVPAPQAFIAVIVG